MDSTTPKPNVNSPVVEKNARFRDRIAGFAAGVASGATKLVVGHPFAFWYGVNIHFKKLTLEWKTKKDTVKIRMQVEGGMGRFSGPMDCLISTIKREKFRGLYKGATPPLIGWTIMDAVQ
ncbi:Mitochondrial substrate carrier family protein L [Smittium culicis]|uniref:Mitochondrial substrate carrier family protein L n=1 Tax=Smittium culicis TaxID=133412 RepID=A0A1R1X4Z5_9FUNG|nr:Mitochondrial substrate carrier family protein L [Smittium culicis]